MPKTLKNLSITRVALVAAGSNPHADVVLIKSKPPVTQPPTKEPSAMKKNIDKSKLSTEEQTVLDALLAKSATDIADPAPAPPSQEEEVIKSLPPEAQAILKKANDTAAAALARADEATTMAVVEKTLREENAFIVAQTPILKNYPGKTDEIGAMLFRVKKTIKDTDYTLLETILKSGSAALEKTTKEIGEDGEATDSTEMADIQTLAKARSIEKKITMAAALEEVMLENSDKIATMRKARQRRRREEDDN